MWIYFGVLVDFDGCRRVYLPSYWHFVIEEEKQTKKEAVNTKSSKYSCSILWPYFPLPNKEILSLFGLCVMHKKFQASVLLKNKALERTMHNYLVFSRDHTQLSAQLFGLFFAYTPFGMQDEKGKPMIVVSHMDEKRKRNDFMIFFLTVMLE